MVTLAKGHVSKIFSLFSAPKDKAPLKLWRHAIPRKDRILEAWNHVCKRHLEPRFVSKTWTWEYNGNILASMPRQRSLADDSVPSVFPNCPAQLTKLKKNRRRPAIRKPANFSKQKCVCGNDRAECAQEAGDQNDSDRDREGCSPSGSHRFSHTASVASFQ